MSNKELYKQAFSALQMTDNISLEESRMSIIRKKVAFRTALAVAAAALMIIIVGGGTAYATNLGDIQSKFDLWINGKQGGAFFQYDGKGGVVIEYVDQNGNRRQLWGWEDPDHPEPLSFEEEKEIIDDLYNDVNVEFLGGVVTLYFQDQVIDLTDKFVNGECELVLHGSNNYEVCTTINYNDKSVTTSGMYNENTFESVEAEEESIASGYSYHCNFNMWIRGKQIPAKLHYNSDGYYAITYVDEDGALAGPGGWDQHIEDICAEKGEGYLLTEDEIISIFYNGYDTVFNDDGTVILYYQDQVIDLTDKFTDGICEIHVIGKPRGIHITVDLSDQSTSACEDLPLTETTSDEVLARVEHRPFPSYPDSELQAGAFRIDDEGNLLVRPARFEGNQLVEYLGNEAKMKFAKDAFIYYCPIEGYWGETTTLEFFRYYLTYHRTGCYYHLDGSGKIDYVRGIPN